MAKAWPKLRAAKNIVLYPHGGFAHTLIVPDWIRRLYPEDRNVTLFGSWPGRHNRLVPLIWHSDLVLVPMADSIFRIRIVGDSLWVEKLFRAAAAVMRRLWPEKRILYSTHDMMDISPRPDFVSPDEFFASRVECYYYHQVINNIAAAPRLPILERSLVEAAILAKCPTNLPRTCNLYLRTKKLANDSDPSVARRNSASIEQYIPVVRFLNSQGYRVFLTGDRDIPDDIRSEFGFSFIDCKIVGVDTDLYHLWVGLETDIHIGSLSGGSAYVHIADIPVLLLDAFSFGEAMPFATVHYKRLKDQKGRLVPPERLLTEFFFDYDCDGYSIVDNTAEELLSAVRDWLPHATPRRAWGVDPESLGVTCPWLKTSQALLSPSWLHPYNLDMPVSHPCPPQHRTSPPHIATGTR